MPPSDEISSKWHLRGVNWAFHYFNYVDLWFTFADGENKAIWMSFVRLCFPHGYWIHLYSFPDVSICSKTEAAERDNTNNLFSSYRELCFGRYTYFYLYPTCILLPAQCLSNQSLWITVLNRVSFFRVIHLKFYCGYWKSEREMDGDGFSVCHDGGSRKYWIYLKKKSRIRLCFIVYFNKTWLPCIYVFEDCTVWSKSHHHIKIQGFLSLKLEIN